MYGLTVWRLEGQGQGIILPQACKGRLFSGSLSLWLVHGHLLSVGLHKIFPLCVSVAKSTFPPNLLGYLSLWIPAHPTDPILTWYLQRPCLQIRSHSRTWLGHPYTFFLVGGRAGWGSQFNSEHLLMDSYFIQSIIITITSQIIPDLASVNPCKLPPTSF